MKLSLYVADENRELALVQTKTIKKVCIYPSYSSFLELLRILEHDSVTTERLFTLQRQGGRDKISVAASSFSYLMKNL